MDRREYTILLAMVGTPSLSGCGAIQGVLGGQDEDQQRVEQIKEEAESPDWNELMTDMDEWKDEPVHYSDVEVTAIDENNNGSFVMAVEHPDSGGTLRCTWFGDKVDIEETFDIWGTVKGKYTYSFGDEKTVPDIKLSDIQPTK